MKHKEILVLGVAAVAAYMILRNGGNLLGTQATGTTGGKKYTAGANQYSPWGGYDWGTLDLPGYALFDGAMDSLGLTSTNTGYGTTGNGLGLKPNGGWGLSYGGLTAGYSGGGASGSW